MAPNELTCPGCGSHRIVNITLPVVAGKDDAHRTRGGHRCMDCATQWPMGGSATGEAQEREDERT